MTAVSSPPASWAAPGRSRTAQLRSDRRVGAVVSVLVVLVVLTQRLAVPLGAASVSVALPLGYAAVGVLVLAGRARPDRPRAQLFALAVAACLLAGVVSGTAGGPWSVTSFGLLVALWALFVMRVTPGGPGALLMTGRAFVGVSAVLAVTGVGQLVLQLSGVWTYRDLLADTVPGQYLARGFNTANPLSYGSSVYKANAFVALEPSYLSQICALAVIVGLVVGTRWWVLLVLLAGLLSAVSGTGVLLLVAGTVVVLVRDRSLVRPGHVLAVAVAGVAALLSPVGALLLARAGEVGQVGTSGYLRFVQPYTEVVRGLDRDVLRYLVGAGPGSSDRLLASARGGTQLGEAVVYTVVPKLVFEYGVVPGGLFVLFVLFSLLDRVPWRAVPGAVVVMVFLLSGSLLQPETIVLAWALTGLWAGSGAPQEASTPDRGDPPASGEQERSLGRRA